MLRRSRLVSGLALLWHTLVLLGLMLIFLGMLVAAVCWPLWALWLLTFGTRAVLRRLAFPLASATGFVVAWVATLALELSFVQWLFPPVTKSQVGAVFAGTLSLAHLGICTPWVLWDLARAP